MTEEQPKCLAMDCEFDSPNEAVRFLIELLTHMAGKAGMTKHRARVIADQLGGQLSQLSEKDIKMTFSSVRDWLNRVAQDQLRWDGKMQIRICCPSAGCTAYRDAMAFLNGYGIEPSIGQDQIGHYFEIELPTDAAERGAFLEALSNRITASPPNH